MSINIKLFDPINGGARMVPENFYVIPNFKAIELACPKGRVIRTAQGFLEHLAVLRLTTEISMNPSSVCRIESHNEEVGGNVRSAHLCDVITKHFTPEIYGSCAIDLPGLQNNEIFLRAAMKLGWSLGLGRTFVHLDRLADFSPSHPDQRLFFYKDTPIESQLKLIEIFRGITGLVT